MYYGLLKLPDIQSLAAPVEDEEEGGEQDAPDKPKKKKAKKDPLFSKKTKSDPNAPPADRIPIPELFVLFYKSLELLLNCFIILGEITINWRK